MGDKQSNNSRFVSIPGLCCLFVLAVTAEYFHAWLISAFLLLIFLLCLSSYVWSRGVLKHVDAEVAAEQESCHAGEHGTLKLRVRNRSFFPLVWLDVIVPTGEKPLLLPLAEADFSWFSFGDRRQTGIRERFVWMMWQQEISWEEEYVAKKRGAVEVKWIYLQAGDGFGLSAKEEFKMLPVPIRIMVYPALIPVQAGRLLRITEESEARNYGQTEDVTLLKSSRPYQTGDQMKRINWRMLAASGQMITNLYETVLPGCVAFVLELENFTEVIEKENPNGRPIEETYVRTGSLERMLSLLASCMRALSERRIQTALIIPAYGEHEAVLSIPGDGRDTLTESLEALALLDYRAQKTSFPFAELRRASHKIGSLFLCARTDGTNGPEELASVLGQGRTTLLALERGEGNHAGSSCLYAEDIGVRWTGEEERYERIS